MICKPELILNEKQCKANIDVFVSKFKERGISFRPHFKTHQSLHIASWFREKSVEKITVSSIQMAEYFAEDWNDITIAFPVNILDIASLNSLAERVNLNITIDSHETAQFVSSNTAFDMGVFIEIDLGYHRTGLLPENETEINKILEVIKKSEFLSFKGFLAHSGDTYNAKSVSEIKQIHNSSVARFVELKQKYIADYPDMIISLGDTPSCSICEEFEGIDELRPGNFIFYDVMQHKLGACSVSQIAMTVACPVVGIYPEREEIVVMGGSVHISKESIEFDGKEIYGLIADSKGTADTVGFDDIIPGMYVSKLSQEHGTISVPSSKIGNYRVGDIVYILPVHSCITANLYKNYFNHEGDIIFRA
ncbi:MAG: alanine racemase [Marinifilaceae bacterium]|jgi:D-serine deaminase-like pyridoxal phosphate-dependent protein|nr:alanine racemase [Marinifilaceae bacterium]